MKTRRSLKDGDVLLVGRLQVQRKPRVDGGHRTGCPVLVIEAWCPHCRTLHTHGFGPPPFRQDAVSFHPSRCQFEGSPLATGYHVGLDSTARDHNLAVVQRFEAESIEHAEAVAGLALPTPEDLVSTAWAWPHEHLA
jgi:hypothetical protein